MLIFGPRYDEETGHRVSPLSHEAFRGLIPTRFRVPACLEFEEMKRAALQSLSRRTGVSIPAGLLASNSKDADTDGAPSTSDGYRETVCLSGDISHWGLPPLDTDE